MPEDEERDLTCIFKAELLDKMCGVGFDCTVGEEKSGGDVRLGVSEHPMSTHPPLRLTEVEPEELLQEFFPGTR